MSNQTASSIISKLNHRDGKQPSYLKEITNNYVLNYVALKKANDEINNLKSQLVISKQTAGDPKKTEEISKINLDLQIKLNKSSEELEAYKFKQIELSQELTALKLENAKLQNEIKSIGEHISDYITTIQLKENTIMMIGEEMSKLMKERNDLIKMKDHLLTEVSELKTVKMQMEQKIIQDKNQLAERMNELNIIHDKNIKTQKLLEEEKKKLNDEIKKFEEQKSKVNSTSPHSKEVRKVSGKEGDDFEIIRDPSEYMSNYLAKDKLSGQHMVSSNVIKLHSSEIYQIVETFSGDTIATCGGDGLIQFFDPKNSVPHLKLKAPSSGQVITCMAFGTDNNTFITGTGDKTVYLWSIKEERVKKSFLGHSDVVNAVDFMKDGCRIISGSSDRLIKIWDIQKGSTIKSILCGTMCYSLFVTSDKDKIISGHSDGSVRVYSARSGDLLKSYKELHGSTVTCVTPSPDGEYVLTAGKDRTLRLIDLRADKPLDIVFSHKDYKNSFDTNKVSFANYGDVVCAGGEDGKIYCWNTKNGKFQETLNTESKLMITACGYNMLSGHFYNGDKDGNLYVWI